MSVSVIANSKCGASSQRARSAVKQREQRTQPWMLVFRTGQALRGDLTQAEVPVGMDATRNGIDVPSMEVSPTTDPDRIR